MNTNRKRVIITGATDGLGLRLAWLFAGQNADLILTGRKSENELMCTLPPGAHYIVADQSKNSCCDIIKSEIDRLKWDHVDHLVLNAGTGRFIDPVSEQSGSISNVMAVNLITPVSIVHNLAQYLLLENALQNLRDRTLVTFIGSTSANGATNFASYAASKAGIAGFVRALASEWRDRVDVQIIHPGPTRTSMHKKAGLNPGFARKFFVDPDYAASRIMMLIDSRAPTATVAIVKYLIYILASKIGVRSTVKKALPQ